MDRPRTSPAVTASSGESPLRIVIADDQTAVRDGLAIMLDLLPDIAVVGAAANGIEALDLIKLHRPDVALIDLHMPLLDGIETTRRLAIEHPDVAVVILTTLADDISIIGALGAGARGYLTKDAGRTDIARALHAAASGQSVLDHHVQSALLRASESRAEPPASTRLQPLPDGLTASEGEVLDLVEQGLTNPQIARSLFLSTHTVKTHINRIFAKTGSANRGEAIEYARRHLGRGAP
jgi:DNA-binding NarL/FixJ family response regulator